MEFEYTLENEQQFWDGMRPVRSVVAATWEQNIGSLPSVIFQIRTERRHADAMRISNELGDILNKDTHEHGIIDDTLRSYLGFVIQFKDEYLSSDYDVLRCAYRLISSPIFKNEQDYVRTQIVYCLLQEDAPEALHVISAFVLFDGRQHESTFTTLNDEGGFSRIVELLQEVQGRDESLHRLLLELMYEMCRIQRVKHHDLVSIDKDFVMHLLEITEGLSADVDDPYHYYVIRVLLVLNEQYMVCAHEPGPNGSNSSSMSNLVIIALSSHGSSYKTFGENIILLLNRESETSLQLLILKLLYLLFTTPDCYEYFYTNDLRVLVDVMIRNLLDLAFSSTALRHTYLRVLHPLLAHTQLKYPENHYKRDELLKLLNVMSGSTAASGLVHFGAMDETTRRLVKRCMTVEWISGSTGENGGSQTGSGQMRESSVSPRMRYLQIGSNPEASKSSLSVAEVSSQHAQPGEQVLSRGEELARQERRHHHEAQHLAAAPVRGDGISGRTAGDGSLRVNGDDSPASMPRLKSPFEMEVEG